MKKFTKILVPVEGIPADEDAIRLACQTAKQDKAKVLMIYVIEVQRNLPLDAENIPAQERGEQVLGRAEQIAHTIHGTAESELLQARVAGSAIVDEAIDRGIDLIVMGVPYRKTLGDFYLGATASYVFKTAPCPVWLCRAVASEDKPGVAEKKK